MAATLPQPTAAPVVADIAADEAARRLLASCALPVADLPQAPVRLLGIRDQDELVAVVGIQTCADCGLLRSLAVAPARRGRGLGHLLTAAAEDAARAAGIATLYLLTTSAVPFFRRRGYTVEARDDAPAAIRATREFATLCPASATLMRKALAPGSR